MLMSFVQVETMKNIVRVDDPRPNRKQTLILKENLLDKNKRHRAASCSFFCVRLRDNSI